MQGSTSGLKRVAAVILAYAVFAAYTKGGILSQADIPERTTGRCMQLACGTVTLTKRVKKLGNKHTLERTSYHSRISKQQVLAEPRNSQINPQKSKVRLVTTRKGH